MGDHEFTESLRRALRDRPDLQPTVCSALPDAASPPDSPTDRQDREWNFGPEYAEIALLAETNLSRTVRALHRPTNSHVVIKMPHERLLLRADGIARFRREIEIVSNLTHRNIVPVRDVHLGEPPYFYTMPFIEGAQLDVYCRQNGLALRARLQLFITVCRAVARAHVKGVIHRDLKPNNILVDDAGEPQLLDFGLGRVLERLDDAGQRPFGAPGYMSPEHVQGLPGDTRTDVYSLGVILYELLTGQLPFRPDGAFDDLRRRVLHGTPAKPSAINGRITRELDAITLKAIARSPADRYQSVDDLADDVAADLDQRPIHALPRSMLYVLRKWVRRNRLLALAAVLILAAVVVGLVREFSHARATELSRHAMAVLAGRSLLQADTPVLASEKLWREHLRYESRRTRFALWELWRNYPCQASWLSMRHSEPVGLSYSVDGARVFAAWRDGAIDVFDGDTAALIQHLPADMAVAGSLCPSADGVSLIVGATDGCLRLFAIDAQNGTLASNPHTVQRLGSAPIRSLAVSTDGHLIAAAQGADVWLLDATRLEPFACLSEETGPIIALALSHDGTRLAAGTQRPAEPDGPLYSGRLLVWDLPTLGIILDRRTVEGGSLRALQFAPGDDRLYVGEESLRIVDLDDGSPTDLENRSVWGVRGLAQVMHAGGAIVACATGDGWVRFWDSARAQLLDIRGFHDAHASTILLAARPDQQTIASLGWDGLKLWRLPTWQVLAAEGDCVLVADLGALAPDGSWWAAVATVGGSREIFTSIDGVTRRADLGRHGSMVKVAVSDQLRVDVIARDDGSGLYVRACDPRARDAVDGTLELEGVLPSGSPLFVSADGLLVPVSVPRASGHAGGAIYLVRVQRSGARLALEALRVQEFDTACSSIAATADGRFVVAGAEGCAKAGCPAPARIVVWEATNEDLAATAFNRAYRPAHDLSVDGLIWRAVPQIDAHGRLLIACTGASDAITLWDPATRTPAGHLRGHSDQIFSLCALDEHTLVSASRDRTVRVWDTRSRAEVCLLHQAESFDVAASTSNGRVLIADGPRILTHDTRDIGRYIAGNRATEEARLGNLEASAGRP